jgi:transposase
MNAKHTRKNLLPIYLKGLVEGKYSLRQVSESTGYSVRHISTLKKKYLTMGIKCLEDGRKNHPAYNRIPEVTRQAILALYVGKYSGSNFQYFHDCLEEIEGIKVSNDFLYKFLKENGIVSPLSKKAKKKDKVNHRPRLRRQNEGDMIQIDGTPYPWFWKFGENKNYCLVGSIDDATSKITGLYMTENECIYGYIEMLRQTIEKYGRPREIYSDRAAIFCVSPKDKKNLTIWEQLEGVHEKKTQWQRMLDELQINQILAWSPEAKGRVERMWGTIQNQLPIWLYINKIDTLDKANKELHKYINQFNRKYAKPAAIEYKFWIPKPDNLDYVLQVRFPRKTDRVGSFSFHGEDFYIKAPSYKNVSFELCISERGIYAYMNDRYYDVYLHNDIQECVSDSMSITTKNIVYKYLYRNAKEFSV